MNRAGSCLLTNTDLYGTDFDASSTRNQTCTWLPKQGLDTRWLIVFGASFPHVISIEVTLPGPGLAYTIKHVTQVSPHTRFLVVTGCDDSEYVHLAIMAGASGYILKSTSASAYLSALRHVLAGDQVMDPRLPAEEIKAARNANTGHPEISHREREVLEFMARGTHIKRSRTSSSFP